jgi:hypothetical protein
MSRSQWIDKRYVIVGILLLIVILGVPFDLIVSPKREFVVMNANDKPIEGVVAKQVRYQYSLNYTKEAETISDHSGHIRFPKRKVKTNLLSIVFGAVLRIVEFKIDANVGSTDTIGVSVDGHKWKWFYDGIGLESGSIKFEKS